MPEGNIDKTHTGCRVSATIAILTTNSRALMMMSTMMRRVRFCAVTPTTSAPFPFCVGTERDENKDNQNEHESRHFKILQAMRKIARGKFPIR